MPATERAFRLGGGKPGHLKLQITRNRKKMTHPPSLPFVRLFRHLRGARCEYVLPALGQCGLANHCGWEGLDFEIDAGDFVAAFLVMTAGALAEFSETDVAVLAEFDSSGNQDAVYVNAGLALEFEEHVDNAGVSGASAQDPSTTAEDC